jgi:hypothetical protein
MMNKWIGISLGTLLGITHIGMIGLIANRKSMPVVNLPVGKYTSYKVEANKDGYRIHYRANDPKTMLVERDIKKKGGFLGLGNNTVRIREEVKVDGSENLSNPVAAQSSRSEECIEAIGAGKGTGKMVGASVGTAVAPSLTGIPFVGWVLAGAATMMGMDAGSDIGGTMVESVSPECEVEDLKDAS